MQAFARPTPLLEGVQAVGDPIAVLPVAYHLLWTRAPAGGPDPRPPGEDGNGHRGWRDVVTVSRPTRLGTGDEVRFRGCTHTVTALSGGLVRLVDAAGGESSASLAELFGAPGDG